MRISMNTALSGSGRVDDIKGHPQGEIRGETKLVNITEDVRKFAAEHGITEEAAIEEGLKQKATEFTKAALKFTQRRNL
jgi:hypothetical protein